MPRRKKIEIKLDGIAGKLGAEIYRDGDEFICLMPIDQNELVVGHGETVADAVSNWDDKLKAHLKYAGDDEVVAFVKSHLTVQPSPTVESVVKGKVKVDIQKTREQNMAAFEAELEPPKKYKSSKTK